MSSPIFEEEGKKPAAGGMATAQQKIEKQARQLAYDTRYQVKKEIGDKKVNPAAMKRLLLQRLQKSTAAPNVKVRAKQMLLGEDYIGDVTDFAAGTVANALFRVFVERVQEEEVVEEIELEYLRELDEDPNRKYKVRVTDKKTGNSYVRYATREKITQLRTNPNIQSVEMTEYGEPREGERSRGEDTARATGGGKKAKKDYDGDGKVESGAKEYRGAVHNAIQRKKGGVPDGKDTSSVKEEFIADAAAQDQNTGKLTGKGVNNYAGKNPAVKIMPEDPTAERPNSGPRSVYAHYEAEGQVIAEKAVSKAQQKFMGMVYAVKQGAKPMSPEVAKAASGMSKKEARKFAKTKHEGLPTHKEEAECGMDEKPKLKKSEGAMDDVRAIPTKVNLVKNKLRSMGLKMSYELEGEVIDEVQAPLAGPLEMRKIERRTQSQPKPSKHPYLPPSSSLVKQAKVKKKAEMQVAGYEPEGEVIDERRREEKGTPRKPRDRAMEVVRSMPNVKQGLMTRGGKTVAQHEAERGVSEKDRPKKKEQTTADRLAAKKQRAAAAQAAVQRSREEEDRRRRLA